MRHDAETNAEIDALNHLASAVVEFLERLRTTSDLSERHELRDEFHARVDGIREDLGHRDGLDEGHAEAIITRSLARVIEAVRGTPSRA